MNTSPTSFCLLILSSLVPCVSVGAKFVFFHSIHQSRSCVERSSVIFSTFFFFFLIIFFLIWKVRKHGVQKLESLIGISESLRSCPLILSYSGYILAFINEVSEMHWFQRNRTSRKLSCMNRWRFWLLESCECDDL